MKKKLKSKLSDSPKFNRFSLLIFVLAMVPVGYFLLISRAAPPPPPNIYLTPETQSIAISTNITFEIRANSGTTGVNAVQANLSYPTTLFDFVSIDSTGSSYSVEAQSTGGNGSINIARGVSGGSTPLTGDRLIARFTLRSKTVGGSGNISFTAGSALVNASTNQNIVPLTSTGGSAVNVDTQAPTVSVTAPTNNAILSNGSAVTVSANASDSGSGVASVAILIDGTQRALLTTAPFNYTWNTGGVALGPHNIQARATDGVGNVSTSTTVNVTLADQTAPSVSVTAPANNSTISGTTNITATSTDNTGGTGVNRVEFYVDNVLRASDTVSPYSYNWDSRSVTDGTHSLTARAYDNANPVNSRTSTAVNITVDNADRTPPTTPGNLRITSNTTSSVSLAWDASTDNVVVTGYRLSRDGQVVSSANSTTYIDNNVTAGQSYTYTVLAFDAAGNNSPSVSLNVTVRVPKPGDVNNDDRVDIMDLSIMLSNWGTSNAACDLNKNGVVDVYDLSILLSNYGS